VSASIVLVPAAFAIFVASETLPRVFACLWEMKCTANRAGGLINLATFGASIVILEVAWVGFELAAPGDRADSTISIGARWAG
jgi:hypothetical protein